jgi:hypothetical protein
VVGERGWKGDEGAGAGLNSAAALQEQWAGAHCATQGLTLHKSKL